MAVDVFPDISQVLCHGKVILKNIQGFLSVVKRHQLYWLISEMTEVFMEGHTRGKGCPLARFMNNKKKGITDHRFQDFISQITKIGR